MANVIFEDYTARVEKALDDRGVAALEEAAGEIESQAIRNTKVGRVNGGKTKANWKHKVDKPTMTAHVGNTNETSVWVELGTGEYALEGKGRKGGWWIPIGNGKGFISQAVVDAYGFRVINGKDGKKYAFTKGMKPQRPLFKAYISTKNKIIRMMQNRFKGL